MGMTPYEVLHNKKSRFPLCWYEVSEKALLGPEVSKETSVRIGIIGERFQIAR
jgi:hypothetical protein